MVILIKKQLASHLHVCPRTIELWVKSGKIPKPFYIGKLAIWDKKQIDTLVARAAETALV